MLQLQRVGVSRLRPRDQEGERNDRPSVCTRRYTHTRARAKHRLPPLSVHARVFVRGSREKRRGESAGETGREKEGEREREERNLTKTRVRFFLRVCHVSIQRCVLYVGAIDTLAPTPTRDFHMCVKNVENGSVVFRVKWWKRAEKGWYIDQRRERSTRSFVFACVIREER